MLFSFRFPLAVSEGLKIGLLEDVIVEMPTNILGFLCLQGHL